MPYTKTTWTDEIPASTPVKYVVTDDVLGEVAGSATIALVTSVTPGTALNATNMNKIETGIETAQAAAESIAAAAILKSIVTTAGDLIYATGSAVLTRLAKGTAHQALYMNSGATAPVWRGRLYAFVSQSSPVTLSHNTHTLVSFNTEENDTGSFFSAGSPTIITIPYTGTYRITCYFAYANSTAGALRETRITLGATVGTYYAADTRGPIGTVSGSLELVRNFTAGNTISMAAYQDTGGNLSFAGRLCIEFMEA